MQGSACCSFSIGKGAKQTKGQDANIRVSLETLSPTLEGQKGLNASLTTASGTPVE